jgi:hypothetical protein
MNIRLWVLIAGCLVLAGCSDPVDEVDHEDEGDEGEVEETVFDPMTDTMDRAAGVEDMGMDRKDEMDKAIDGS